MTIKEFNPTDSTGPEDKDMLFRSFVTSADGARFDLFKEKHHKREDIEKAKRYLKSNFDVVAIHVIAETE